MNPCESLEGGGIIDVIGLFPGAWTVPGQHMSSFLLGHANPKRSQESKFVVGATPEVRRRGDPRVISFCYPDTPCFMYAMEWPALTPS